jgi:proteic killer suppression protein
MQTEDDQSSHEPMTLELHRTTDLKKLKGIRAGQHSIRINDQWRICFTWEETDAYDVEIVDYH